MKKVITFLILLVGFSAFSQDILGQWKTIDDQTGEAKSVVELYKEEGKVYGKVVDIFDASKRNSPCENCKGDDYNKPVLGLVIIKNMVKDGDYYKNGTVLDPQDGKVYKLRLGLTDDGKLQVRGYLGFFYSTQYWERIN